MPVVRARRVKAVAHAGSLVRQGERRSAMPCAGQPTLCCVLLLRSAVEHVVVAMARAGVQLHRCRHDDGAAAGSASAGTRRAVTRRIGAVAAARRTHLRAAMRRAMPALGNSARSVECVPQRCWKGVCLRGCRTRCKGHLSVHMHVALAREASASPWLATAEATFKLRCERLRLPAGPGQDCHNAVQFSTTRSVGHPELT